MVKKITFSFIVFLVIISGIAATSQAFTLQVDELIIMIPDAAGGRNDKTISNELAAIPGVEVVGFCNTQKCFYLHVDRTQQPDNANIIDAIRRLGMQMEIKISGTIQEAQNNCADRN